PRRLVCLPTDWCRLPRGEPWDKDETCRRSTHVSARTSRLMASSGVVRVSLARSSPVHTALACQVPVGALTMDTFFRVGLFGHPAPLAPITPMDPAPIPGLPQWDLDGMPVLFTRQDEGGFWLRCPSLNSSIINKGRNGSRGMLNEPFSVDDCAPAEIAFEFGGGERHDDLGHRACLPIGNGNAVRDPVDVPSLSDLTHLLLPQP